MSKREIFPAVTGKQVTGVSGLNKTEVWKEGAQDQENLDDCVQNLEIKDNNYIPIKAATLQLQMCALAKSYVSLNVAVWWTVTCALCTLLFFANVKTM